MTRDIAVRDGTFASPDNRPLDWTRVASLETGLPTLYEGETICRVQEREMVRKGFRVFARTTSGYASVLVLNENENENGKGKGKKKKGLTNRLGRMIVDTGYSRFFTAGRDEILARWLNNAIIWLSRPEQWLCNQMGLVQGEERMESGIDMSQWQEGQRQNSPISYSPRKLIAKYVQICVTVILDTTASMASHLEEAKQAVERVLAELEGKIRENDVKAFHLVSVLATYKDYAERFSIPQPSCKQGLLELREEMEKVVVGGGSDGPLHCNCSCEDIQLGVERALEVLGQEVLQEYSHLIIVVGDASQHGDNPTCSCQRKMHPIERCSMRDAWTPLLTAIKELKNQVVVFIPVGGDLLLHTAKTFETEGIEIVINNHTQQVQTQIEKLVKAASEDREFPFPGLF